MSAQITGRRGLERLDEELSGRDRSILGQVADLRLMSARQIELVHFAAAEHASSISAARCCRRVLERLVRDRLLTRLERRIGGVRAGSASYVYAIGPVGQRLVGRDEARKRFREPSATYALHTLAIAQLVTDLTVQSRSGRVEILQLQAEPACWRTTTGMAGSTLLRPDLFVSLGIREYEYRWLIEVDLGTEPLPTLLRKCQAYEAYYRSGREQHEHGVFPRVLWLMHSAERVERLQAAIASDTRLTSALFSIVTSEQAITAVAGASS